LAKALRRDRVYCARPKPFDLVSTMWENAAVAMTNGVVRGGLGAAEPWLDPDELRWFAPRSGSVRSDTRNDSRRSPIRHVEASLADLSRAAAAALTPVSLIDGTGALAMPAPAMPPLARHHDYRTSRRQNWTPRRRKRFATRFVPAATLVVSAAVTLPSLLLRDDRSTRIAAVPLSAPGLELGTPAPFLPPNSATTASAAAVPAVDSTLADGSLGNVDGAVLAAAGVEGGSLALAQPGAESPVAQAVAETAANTAPPDVAETRYEQISWRESEAHGLPYLGHLHDGVRLPIEGPNWITWDPTHNQVPNRVWRLHGTDKTVRILTRVARAHRVANPTAPPLLIGDISAKDGGPLDQHVSHQNGLDIDVYYPRKDGKPTEPTSTDQIDLALAQDLVDRFVAAGAQFVFVGYSTPLRGPAGVVTPYRNHENHLHVRLRP
jgi:hypothetical protein